MANPTLQLQLIFERDPRAYAARHAIEHHGGSIEPNQHHLELAKVICASPPGPTISSKTQPSKTIKEKYKTTQTKYRGAGRGGAGVEAKNLTEPTSNLTTLICVINLR